MAIGIGNGSTFEIADASGTAYAVVARVTNASPEGGEAEELDVTTLGSPGGFREFFAGLKDAGTMSLELIWDPADPTHTGTNGITSLWGSNVQRNMRLTLPPSMGGKRTLTFVGFIRTEPVLTVTPDSIVSATVTIRRTGPSVWA